MIIYTTIQAIADRYQVSKYIANKRYAQWFIVRVYNQRKEKVGYIFTRELLLSNT